MSYKLFLYTRNIVIGLACLFLISCTEQQTFDNTFKLSMKLNFIEYCNNEDSNCKETVNKQFDNCFEQGGYDTEEIYQISKNTTLSQSKQGMSESEINTFIEFGKSLENCMAENIGGYYADNISNGYERNIKITRPNVSQAKNGGILIAIKSNGDIWANKDIVKIKDIKSIAQKLITKNPQAHAVIIADKDSSIQDFVTIMDLLKSAGIDNISLSDLN